MTGIRHPNDRVGTVTPRGRKGAPRAIYARILAAADKTRRLVIDRVIATWRVRTCMMVGRRAAGMMLLRGRQYLVIGAVVPRTAVIASL